MAVTQNLAPEAYTRDTLVKAIEWVSSQPPQVRERAKSADLIVSLYLAARRKAAATMESPQTESFKADLKSLAEEFRAADEPALAPPSPPPPQPMPATRSPSHTTFEPQAQAAPPQSVPARFPSAVRAPAQRAVQNFQWAVDDRSLEIAREVQDRFNLSQESEALRLLIQLGSERMRQLFS